MSSVAIFASEDEESSVLKGDRANDAQLVSEAAHEDELRKLLAKTRADTAMLQQKASILHSAARHAEGQAAIRQQILAERSAEVLVYEGVNLATSDAAPDSDGPSRYHSRQPSAASASTASSFFPSSLLKPRGEKQHVVMVDRKRAGSGSNSTLEEGRSRRGTGGGSGALPSPPLSSSAGSLAGEGDDADAAARRRRDSNDDQWSSLESEEESVGPRTSNDDEGTRGSAATSKEPSFEAAAGAEGAQHGDQEKDQDLWSRGIAFFTAAAAPGDDSGLQVRRSVDAHDADDMGSLRAENAALKARVAELEGLLGLTGSSASVPSSGRSYYTQQLSLARDEVARAYAARDEATKRLAYLEQALEQERRQHNSDSAAAAAASSAPTADAVRLRIESEVRLQYEERLAATVAGLKAEQAVANLHATRQAVGDAVAQVQREYQELLAKEKARAAQDAISVTQREGDLRLQAVTERIKEEFRREQEIKVKEEVEKARREYEVVLKQYEQQTDKWRQETLQACQGSLNTAKQQVDTYKRRAETAEAGRQQYREQFVALKAALERAGFKEEGHQMPLNGAHAGPASARDGPTSAAAPTGAASVSKTPSPLQPQPPLKPRTRLSGIAPFSSSASTSPASQATASPSPAKGESATSVSASTTTLPRRVRVVISPPAASNGEDDGTGNSGSSTQASETRESTAASRSINSPEAQDETSSPATDSSPPKARADVVPSNGGTTFTPTDKSSKALGVGVAIDRAIDKAVLAQQQASSADSTPIDASGEQSPPTVGTPEARGSAANASSADAADAGSGRADDEKMSFPPSAVNYGHSASSSSAGKSNAGNSRHSTPSGAIGNPAMPTEGAGAFNFFPPSPADEGEQPKTPQSSMESAVTDGGQNADEPAKAQDRVRVIIKNLFSSSSSEDHTSSHASASGIFATVIGPPPPSPYSSTFASASARNKAAAEAYLAAQKEAALAAAAAAASFSAAAAAEVQQTVGSKDSRAKDEGEAPEEDLGGIFERVSREQEEKAKEERAKFSPSEKAHQKGTRASAPASSFASGGGKMPTSSPSRHDLPGSSASSTFADSSYAVRFKQQQPPQQPATSNTAPSSAGPSSPTNTVGSSATGFSTTTAGAGSSLPPPPRPDSLSPKLYATIVEMSVTNLRGLLQRAGIPFADCVEKRELQARLIRAVTKGQAIASATPISTTHAPSSAAHGDASAGSVDGDTFGSATAASSAAANDVDNWLPAQAPDGAQYFYHRVTRAVRWDKPTASPEASASRRAASGASKNQKWEDDASTVGSGSVATSEWGQKRDARILEEQQGLKQRQASRLAELKAEQERAAKEAATKQQVESEIDQRVKRWCGGAAGSKTVHQLLLTLPSVLVRTSTSSSASSTALTSMMTVITTELSSVRHHPFHSHHHSADSAAVSNGVRKSYKAAVKVLHPDKHVANGITSIEAQLEAQKAFAALTDAYKKYTAPTGSPSSPPSYSSGPTTAANPQSHGAAPPPAHSSYRSSGASGPAAASFAFPFGSGFSSFGSHFGGPGPASSAPSQASSASSGGSASSAYAYAFGGGSSASGASRDRRATTAAASGPTASSFHHPPPQRPPPVPGVGASSTNAGAAHLYAQGWPFTTSAAAAAAAAKSSGGPSASSSSTGNGRDNRDYYFSAPQRGEARASAPASSFAPGSGGLASAAARARAAFQAMNFKPAASAAGGSSAAPTDAYFPAASGASGAGW